MSKQAAAKVVVVAMLACLGLSACEQEIRGGEAVRTETYVLIDLSETWYNQETQTRNRRLLEAVGRGAGLVADGAEPPYMVQYRVIGDLSYMREPICTVVYAPGFRRAGGDEVVRRPRDVVSYLTGICLDGIFESPPEQATEISGALASVAEEPRPSPNTSRSIIVLSDFLEETSGRAAFAPGSFAGVDVLLLYRPLEEDLRSQAGARMRVQFWQEQLRNAGADTVEIAPDTSVRASQIVSFLTND